MLSIEIINGIDLLIVLDLPSTLKNSNFKIIKSI